MATKLQHQARQQRRAIEHQRRPGEERHLHRDPQDEVDLPAADGKLIVLNGNGQLTLLEVSSEEMVLLASARIFHDRAWAPPALADGVLYVRGLSEMVTVRLAKESVSG